MYFIMIPSMSIHLIVKNQDVEMQRIVRKREVINLIGLFWNLKEYANKKHTDASVKERPHIPLVPSEEICKRVLCNKHI